MDVKVVNLSYLLPTSKPRDRIFPFLLQKTEDLLLLDEVSFHLPPGSVTGFLGIGLGYKCLIECIALRQFEGLLNGKVLYDNILRPHACYQDIVLIHDMGIPHFESLSVFDYMYYGVKLRLSLSEIESRERVRYAIKAVELGPLQIIGELTSVELRALDVAMELVTYPKLLCLLDPFEGLDASSKIDFMRILHNISHSNTTPCSIVYNLTSIDENCLSCLDQVGIFTGNRLEYMQIVASVHSRSLDSFKSLMIQTSLVISDHAKQFPNAILDDIHPSHIITLWNLLDQMRCLEMAEGALPGASSKLTLEQRVQQRLLQQHHLQSPAARDRFMPIVKDSNPQLNLPFRIPKSIREECYVLIMRSLQYHLQNGLYLRFAFLRLTICSLIISAIVFSNGNDFDNNPSISTSSYGLTDPSAYNVTSICYIIVAVALLGPAFSLRYLHANIRLLKFEVKAGLQRTFSSWMSLLFIDVPLYSVVALINGLVFFFMVNLQGSIRRYFGTIFLTILTGYSLVLACAIWFHSLKVASFVFVIVASLSLLFAGYFQVISNLVWFWYWVSSVVFTRWAFEALMKITFHDAVDSENYLDTFNFADNDVSYCQGWILLWFVGFQILIVIGLLPQWNSFKWQSTNTIKGKAGDNYLRMNEDSISTNANNSLVTTTSGNSIAVKSTSTKTDDSGTPVDDANSNAGSRATSTVSLRMKLISQATTSSAAAMLGRSKKTGSNNASNAPHLIDVDFITSLAAVKAKPIPLPRHKITTLSFSRIRYYQDYILNSPTGNDSDPILNGITGTIQPGTSCCILNSRNDSKRQSSSSILLHILSSNQQLTGKITGVISINQQRITKLQSYHANMAYVCKGDMPHLSSLTVREALQYAVMLREPADTASIGCCGGSCFSKAGWNSTSRNTLFGDRGTIGQSWSTNGSSRHTGSSHHTNTSQAILYEVDMEDSMYEAMSEPSLARSQSESSRASTSMAEAQRRHDHMHERVEEILMMLGLESVAELLIGSVSTSADDKVHRNKSLSVSRTIRQHYRKQQSAIPFLGSSNTAANGQINEEGEAVATSITPAQWRLLTIGLELINQPGLIFLEDPFYNLEYHDAEVIAKTIRCLTEGNRSVVCSVEQPMDSLLPYFDEMMLLGSGLLIYSGETKKAQEYFQNIGFVKSPQQSVLDFVLEIASDKGKMATNTPGSNNRQRASNLSPEDLADLNRSLVNIQATKRASETTAVSAVTNPLVAAAQEREEETGRGSVTIAPFQNHLRDSQHSLHASSHRGSKTLSSADVSLPSQDGPWGPAKRTSANTISSAHSSSYISPQHTNPSNSLYRASFMDSSPSISSATSSHTRTTNTTAKSIKLATNTKPPTSTAATTKTLLRRGFVLLLNDREAILWYLGKCLLAGFFIGSVWFDLDNGDVDARMSLFAALYIVLNVLVVDSLEGIYHRKALFMRENFVGASNFISYYFADSLPSLVLYAVGSFLTMCTTYPLSNLRPTVGHFLYLYLLVLISLYCNYSLAYVLSMNIQSLHLCKTVYSGLVIPLQLLMSGYLVLIPSMDSWNSWGAYICPMSYFLAGAVRNEFEFNNHALNEDNETTTMLTYSNVEDQYDFHLTLVQTFFAIFLMGIILKICWLIQLRMYVLFQERAVRRKLIGFRRRMRAVALLCLSTCLRWTSSSGSRFHGDEDGFEEA